MCRCTSRLYYCIGVSISVSKFSKFVFNYQERELPFSINFSLQAYSLYPHRSPTTLGLWTSSSAQWTGEARSNSVLLSPVSVIEPSTAGADGDVHAPSPVVLITVSNASLHWGCGRPRPHNGPAKHGQDLCYHHPSRASSPRRLARTGTSTPPVQSCSVRFQ